MSYATLQAKHPASQGRGVPTTDSLGGHQCKSRRASTGKAVQVMNGRSRPLEKGFLRNREGGWNRGAGKKQTEEETLG